VHEILSLPLPCAENLANLMKMFTRFISEANAAALQYSPQSFAPHA